MNFSFSFMTFCRLGGASVPLAWTLRDDAVRRIEMVVRSIFLSILLSRKIQGDSESMRRSIAYIKVSSMVAHNMFYDRESYSHTLILACPSSVYTVELFFDKWYVFFGDTNSVVFKYQNHLFFILLESAGECCFWSCVFDEIRKYIVYYL